MGSSPDPLAALGYGSFFAERLAARDPEGALVPARVVADSRGSFAIAGCQATSGVLSGRLRHELAPDERPVAGDWLAVADADGCAVIHHVLERRSSLRRRASGPEGRVQVLAANVDRCFIVTSADRDLNPRRLERYLAVAWDGGAQPVVVLNKADLAADLGPSLEILSAIALAAPIVAVSAHSGAGIDSLRARIEPGVTIAFVGSSGVGKSSLINRLLGEERLATAALGTAGKGQHTTTGRALVSLPGGGLLIDTPGMRELGLARDDGGIAEAFADVAELAGDCRFADCRHLAEPGCAVRAAIERGELDPVRLSSFHKLEREARAEERRRDPAQASNAKRRWKSIHKQMRAYSRSDPKRRGG